MIEKMINNLENKYGDDFNWMGISNFSSKTSFVDELKIELGENHALNDKDIFALAKCTSNDDVLFSYMEGDKEIFFIYHLTYSHHIECSKIYAFENVESIERYLEQQFVENYL